MKNICTYIMLSVTIFVFGCMASTVHAQILDPVELAIVDTTERDESLYKPIIDILETVGFRVTYKPLHLILDQSVARLALPSYKAVLFIFGSEFLSGMGRSYFCAKVLQALQQYARIPGVMVGLVFPPLRSDPRVNIVGSCASIFNSLGLSTPTQALDLMQLRSPYERVNALAQQKLAINAFFYLTNVFLATPLETRPMEYHTTLNLPHNGILFKGDQISNILTRVNQPLYLLPIQQGGSVAIQQTLPYGLYWFNPVRKNHVFITTSTLLSFAGISENFQICPTDFMLRHEMLALVQRMFWEVSLLSRGMNVASQAPRLPSSLASVGLKRSCKAPAIISRKTAWMEINVFQDNSGDEHAKNAKDVQERQEQRVRLIDYIMDSGIDALWITINPQMYYSPAARLGGKNNEKIFLDAWSRFTKALHEAATQRGIAAPNILVGYEITNNMYEPNMPKEYPIDMYENAYKDLPIPTDYAFWEQEVVKPLEVFMKKWKDPEISHGICISGVVLDLEMYCRKKTGTFLTPMGFEDQTFKKFIKQMRFDWGDVALRDRPLMLMKRRSGGAYFRFLEQESERIGARMQQHFLKAIPDCQIMCYMPHVNVSWFYKGLYKGLGRNQHPLQLLTFNSEFFAHEAWFKRHRINAYHSSVLMLSKLNDANDFSWVDYVLNHHHGVWLNRFSRFSEPKARDWTSIEQPRMPEDLYPAFMDYMRER